MSTWDNNLADKSAKTFESIIPVLEKYFNGKIYSTEDHESQFSKLLDYKCAIDALVDTNEAVFGIAHRVKYSYYKDFTIRTYDTSGKLTEFDKISRPGIKPRFHVQTVCVNDKPTIIAIAKTADLVYAINQGLYSVKTAFSGDKFAILNWNRLADNNINIDIIKL